MIIVLCQLSSFNIGLIARGEFGIINRVKTNKKIEIWRSIKN